MKKVLILGASGMLGHKVFEVLFEYEKFDVYGTVTSMESFGGNLPEKYFDKVITGIYANEIESIRKVVLKIKPDVVINCIGVIKQSKENKDIENNIVINALFPHQVASICEEIRSKFITIATDCVFDGKKGNYIEKDLPTCHDIYGMTKYLGEVNNGKALTLRTSIIGHELFSNLSLVDWFLFQETEKIDGYTRAIFSGLTTLELSKLLAEKLIDSDLTGLYHLSVNSISKYDLLNIISKIYCKNIKFVSNDSVEINRSLDSTKLRSIIGYIIPNWELLVKEMHDDFLRSDFYIEKRKKYEHYKHF